MTAVAVVNLSDGAVLAEHDFPNTGSVFPDPGASMATQVVASANGRYLAVLHSIQPAYSLPGQASPPATVPPLSQPVAASPAGPPLPVPTYIDIFDVDHPGQPIARLASAQIAAFSGETNQPGWSSDQIVLLRPDGQSTKVTDGQLAGP